ncbi:hypothetical protein RHGRI_021795 [Rhododendron griersonianum]|uniref:Uncharacterized protein n=1 Tax=Rhododendron griersonianum TaxID=479676 RepID=A0AAV6JMV6_9ERIC|nr:hypothetical protein RHGRI_021795 [Rhododendron griersonianum]
MALRKKCSSNSPMKSLCIVFVVLMLMTGTQFRGVHCRALRELKSATTAEQVEADELMAAAKFDEPCYWFRNLCTDFFLGPLRVPHK